MAIDAITISLFLASAVRLASPLLLAALGELVSERAGVFNVGLEGIMLMAAFAAAATTLLSGSPLMGVAGGAMAGVLAAAILAVAVVMCRADQVVAGIGFNLLALGATSLLRQMLLSGPTQPVSVRDIAIYRIPGLSNLPIVGRAFFSQSPLLYSASLRRSRCGWCCAARAPACSFAPPAKEADAADAAGLSVTAIRFSAMLFTGLMTGLGGAVLAIVASGATFVDDLTAGRGYLAIAIAIFGRWHPLWVLVTALLFGCADALQYQGQSMGIAIAPPLLLMLPFILALLAWVAIGRSKSTPADLGRPFLRGTR